MSADARVVVTGAGSGIGRAIARRYLSQDAHVLGIDREAISLNESFESEPRGQAVVADVCSRECADVVAAFGPADVLVNAAGILRRHSFVDHPIEAWNETIAANLTGPFRLSRQFAADHIARAAPGVIVNVCSVESFMALPNHAAYTASKTALLMLTRAFAFELASREIRVVGIAPGVTETGMNSDVRSNDATAQALRGMIPLGRFARPEEIAAAVAFLASEDASYITGSVLLADGGLHVY